MDKQIEDLYTFLHKHSIIKQLTNNSNDFFDEPKLFSYDLIMNNVIQDKVSKSGLLMTLNNLSSNGVSFTSKKLALLKCLTEAVERICLFSFLQENTFIEKFSKLTLQALKPSSLNKSIQIDDIPFGWVKGKDIETTSEDRDILIPAQLAYINYHWYRKGAEPLLANPISTGGAAGFSYEETVLRGIYEVIERDSIMNMYLATIPVPHIDLSTIKSNKVKKVLQKLKNYKLSLTVFYILSDFGIPTYLSILIDDTAIGPKVTVGMKTTLHAEKGILGSIEETMLMRPYTRKLMRDNVTGKVQVHEDITSVSSRALFWAKKEAIQYLDFLYVKSKKIPYKSVITLTNNIKPQVELKTVIKQISEKGFKIYAVDIKLPILKKIPGLTVLKIIIPHLQGLYLDESKKMHNIKRLVTFSKLFNKEFTTVNPIPHPYL